MIDINVSGVLFFVTKAGADQYLEASRLWLHLELLSTQIND